MRGVPFLFNGNDNGDGNGNDNGDGNDDVNVDGLGLSVEGDSSQT
jgi:hypothetical protein